MMRLELHCTLSLLCILKCLSYKNLLMFKIANRKKKKDQKILYLIPGRQRELLSLKMQLSDIDLQHSRFSRTCHLELNMGLRLELLVELVLVNQLLHRLYLGF